MTVATAIVLAEGWEDELVFGGKAETDVGKDDEDEPGNVVFVRGPEAFAESPN